MRLWLALFAALLLIGDLHRWADASSVPHSPEASNASGLHQRHPRDPSHLFLVPLTTSAVDLLTHTVDIDLGVEEDRPVLTVAAHYRLHNPDPEPRTLPVGVVPAAGQMERPLPTEISLAVDGQTLALQPSNDGEQTAQVSLGADARQTLILRYQLSLHGDLPTLAYPMAALSAWPTAPASWRVSVTLPGEATGLLPAESWITTAPEGWTYNSQALQWLSEAAPPDHPITLQFIAPALWREIQQTQRALTEQSSSSLFLRLGDLYNRLYRSPQVDEAGRQRFYAQALAAYAGGIAHAEQTNAPAAERAPLHRALGALYRSRSVNGDGSLNYEYVDLMVQEAEAALAALPAEDPQRRELTQWLAEGLRLQLTVTQNGRRWQQALSLLDRMAQLPADRIDPAWLAEERRTVQLLQALELLERGNLQAAQDLAGPAVLADELLPRPELRALFARWQVTLTLQPDSVRVDAVAHPVPGRQEQVRQSVEQLQQAWQAQQEQGVRIELQPDGMLLVRLDDVALSQRLALAQALPATADWALLRALLVNIDLQIERTSRLIWQQIDMAQPLDLRSVADQWRGVAALLERQVAEIETTANTAASLQAVHASQEVSEALRRIHLQQEAEAWQQLVQSSTVQVQMQTDTKTGGRSWAMRLTDAPQVFRYQVEEISYVRLGLLTIVGLLLVLIVSTILWLLL